MTSLNLMFWDREELLRTTENYRGLPQTTHGSQELHSRSFRAVIMVRESGFGCKGCYLGRCTNMVHESGFGRKGCYLGTCINMVRESGFRCKGYYLGMCPNNGMKLSPGKTL